MDLPTNMGTDLNTTEQLAAALDADRQAQKTSASIVLYVVPLGTIISHFDRIVEYIGRADARKPRMFCNFNARIVAVSGSAAHEFSTWFEYGNAYSVTGLTENPHICKLSLYQLATARVSNTVLLGAEVYFETPELLVELDIQYEKREAHVYQYDYSLVKKYKSVAREPIDDILYSKDPISCASFVGLSKRYIRVFAPIFGNSSLVAIEATYSAEAASTPR